MAIMTNINIIENSVAYGGGIKRNRAAKSAGEGNHQLSAPSKKIIS